VASFDAAQLAIHFAKHHADFSVTNETEYEKLADVFMASVAHPDVVECTRKQGDIVRYHRSTAEFGVLSAAGIIRTYFRAKPCASLPPTVPKVACHGYASNLQYFKAECSRIC
jgi:pyocin large subunit-like protein